MKLAKKFFIWSLSSRNEQIVYLSLREAGGDEAIPEIATPRQVGARNDKEELLNNLNESSRQGITVTPSYG
jgi:hypothetical protein